MRGLEALDAKEARALRGVLFDLDDTLLSHGVLTRDAYDALWQLADHRDLRLIAVTGRPSGWGEVIARQWPVDAVVTENGAVVVSRRGRSIEKHDTCGHAERLARKATLDALVARVRVEVPDALLADDVAARTSDVTWDIGETMVLPEPRIAGVIACIEQCGARWMRSSVHLHATLDSHDKASGAVAWLTSAYDEDAGAARARYAFIGDSGNDRSCFAAFHTTFGVFNVTASLGAFSVLPRWLSAEPMGAGFAEIARALLARRG